MEKNQKCLHIAMFPWLAHGHIMPYFELSKSLAQKGHKISFISTPKNLDRISNKIPQNLSNLIALVSLPLPHVDGLPLGAESTSELPIHRVPFLKRAYDKLELGVTQFLRHDSLDVSWVIHDFASHWMSRVTAPLGIDSVFFSIFSAATMLYFGSPEEILSGRRSRPEDFTVAPPWMEGTDAVAFKLHEIASHWDCMDSEVSDFERVALSYRGCEAFILRTSAEFELNSLSGIETILGKPVLPIGFFSPSPEECTTQLQEKRWEKLRAWLDEREGNSVVYIALGTELGLSQELMHKLASGVEMSGLPFIWVVNDRPLVEGTYGMDILTPGFESRVKGRGFVLRGWAPQTGVLGHPSVGGFLTHCGWSSVIEGLAFGRALILLPGGSSDLGLVARLLSGRGIGLEVPRDDSSGLFSDNSVAESIRRVMVDPEGDGLRKNAKMMKDVFGNFEIQNKYLNALDEFVVNYKSSKQALQ